MPTLSDIFTTPDIIREIANQIEKKDKYIARLEAELAAHKKNEGEECPLCACEAERDALIELMRNAVLVDYLNDDEFMEKWKKAIEGGE